MPLLTSGRHVVSSASPYFENLTTGSDESEPRTIMAFRLSLLAAKKLRVAQCGVRPEFDNLEGKMGRHEVLLARADRQRHCQDGRAALGSVTRVPQS